MKNKKVPIVATMGTFYLLFVDMFFKRFCQLVGTRGRFETTSDPLKAFNCLGNLHTFYKTCHALCVSCAATVEFYGNYYISVNFNIYRARAYRLCFIRYVFHFYILFIFQYSNRYSRVLGICSSNTSKREEYLDFYF